MAAWIMATSPRDNMCNGPIAIPLMLQVPGVAGDEPKRPEDLIREIVR